MNIKSILSSYSEFLSNYYMNEDAIISHDDEKIAEEIADKNAIKMLAEFYHNKE